MFPTWTVLFIVAVSTIEAEIVTTASGTVEGTEGVSRDGRKYKAFYGIPYAEPPVENLRFKNPLPIKAWEGVKNCTYPGPPCYQVQGFIHHVRNFVFGQEDCLTLNIFTPKIKTEEPLAVLFHVHGGGFMEGAAPGPGAADYFMDEDVVLVTIQYRVGIFGFLSLEDEILPGNFGLKDQALALAWVKSNIANFGGNPEKITIFGQSAGGASVHYLMKSPLSKDMIKGAISESGVVARTWAIAPKNTAKERALKVADMLECSGSSQEILNCLQKADAEKLVRTKNSFFVWDYSPFIPFKPVVEPKESNGAFITEDPLKITSNIPWITGVASAEGILVSGSLTTQNPSLIDEFIQNIDVYLLHLFCVENINSDASKQTAKLIKEKYFKKFDRESVLNEIQEAVSDGHFVVPMINAVEKHKGPKYLYLYDYRAGSSSADIFGKQPKDLGVAHADETVLLFNMKEYFSKTKKGETEVSNNLIKMWAKFAQDGKPSSDWNEWENGEYLLIREKNTMKKGLGNDVIKFWNNLPLYRSQVKSEL